MRKGFALVAALTAALSPLAGCMGKTLVNSYLLDESYVGGDPAKSLKPIKGVLVWPLENIASGTKSKGVETRFSGVLADTLTLRSSFERVVVLEEDQAKDLMTRAGEELGLKKKPKTPGDGALIATKLGQLTNTEALLTGRIEDYDEDKVDKATITVVSGSFNLIDTREKAYATLDSFAPVKRVWRTNVKRASQEGPFNSRESIDDAARLLITDAVLRMTADLGQGAAASGKALAKKLAEMNGAAEKHFDAGEFDKAIAGWNEVLKVQADNKKAKKGIESAEKAKVQAEEKAKAAALQKQIDEIKGRAEDAAEGARLEDAIAEWKKILELDKNNKEVARSIERLEKQVADRKKKEAEEAEERKAKEESGKKTAEPAAPAGIPKAVEAPTPVEAPKAVETPKAVEAPTSVEAPKAVETPKAVEAPTPVEAPKAVEAPTAVEAPAAVEKKAEEAQPEAAAGEADLEAVRNQAMAAFNKEDYTTSRDLWKEILSKSPDDKQAKEMLETTEMLLNALK